MALIDFLSPVRRLILSGLFGAALLVSCGGGGDGAGIPAGPLVNEAGIVSVSGIITAAPYLAVDSSVNDPNAPYISNRAFADAQLIANPVLLGGYVTRQPTGVSGDRFEHQDDRFDTYLVTLAAGQRVTMRVSDFVVGEKEVDLLLWDIDEQGRPLSIRDSAIAAEMLQVTAPADGEYFLDVQAFVGASKYLLEVGSMPSLQEMGYPEPLRSHLEMVAGEVIITLREDDADQEIGTERLGVPSARALAAELGMRKKGGGPGREILLHLEDPSGSAKVLERLGLEASARATRMLPDEPRAARSDTVQLAGALAGHPAVARATPNYLHRQQVLPDDPHFGLQWHYPLINLPAAWEITTGSAATVVAVVDGGVYLAHPDLAANLTTNGSNGGDGWNFVDCSPPQDCSNPDDPGDSLVPGSSSWHGTHVAGTVGAVSNNAKGVAGAAWDVSLMPVRVCGQGGTCSSYAVLQGVRYAAGLANDSGQLPQKAADVINLSLGGPAFESTAAALYQQVCEAGVIVVAAAGNGNSSSSLYPAAYPCVLSVAALDAQSQRAPYSNFGPNVDLAAPGGNMKVDSTGDGYPDGVLSTSADDRSGSRKPAYAFMQGTSMAAPHLSGVMALMRSLNPDITPAHIRAWLQEGLLTEPLGGAAPGEHTEEFGYGRLDGLRAVAKALEDAPPVLVASPSLLSFNAGAGPLDFTLQSIGGDLHLVDMAVAADWLSVSAQQIDEFGLGVYRVEVDADSLVPGNYIAELVATADSGVTAKVTVTLRVPDPAGAMPPDAGVHYVLLITEDLVTRYKAMVKAENGKYHFKMEVGPGSYYIVAGSDLDNDRLICTPGEACGAYPSPGLPLLVEIKAEQEEITGLDFITTYGAGFSDSSALRAALPFRAERRRDLDFQENRQGKGVDRAAPQQKGKH